MHKGLVAALLMTALALAGCSGGKKDADFADVTCPDGTIVTSEQIEAVEAHHEAGFDPLSLCPIPPAVTLTGLPVSVQVYKDAAFSWGIDPGSVAHGHSMITEIRYSTASVPDADASIEAYNKLFSPPLKKEHQDLPKTFKGNMSFTVPGKVYVRAYAAVQGEGFDRRDVWGPEVVLDVLPVAATGNVTTVTDPVSPLDPLDPAQVHAKLGDAIKFSNDGLTTVTLTLDSAPAGAAACELSAGTGAESADSCMFAVPGAYNFVTDDVRPKSLTVEVTA